MSQEKTNIILYKKLEINTKKRVHLIIHFFHVSYFPLIIMNNIDLIGIVLYIVLISIH